MKYTVDVALCAARGQCFRTAPEVFQPDDAGYNQDVGRTVHVEPEHYSLVQRAARNCPEQAIRVLSDAHTL